jgi:hypothetical protein
MHEVKKGTQSFYIGESEDNWSATITYVYSGENHIIVEHTYVSEALNGQGVGKLLLKALTDWAREENLKITPECSYAKAQMEKNSEYHDLIYNEA